MHDTRLSEQDIEANKELFIKRMQQIKDKEVKDKLNKKQAQKQTQNMVKQIQKKKKK